MVTLAAGFGDPQPDAERMAESGRRNVSTKPSPPAEPQPTETTAPAPAAPPVLDAPVQAAAAPAPPPPISVVFGKGMWLNQLERAEGGNPEAIVARARAAGLTHLYVRLGSSKKGFYAQGDLDRILPTAHAAGLKIVGWDFPYLADPAGDAARAHVEIAYTTRDGHRIDAFSADIETGSEGVALTAIAAESYGARLRELAGAGYPLVATVPRPVPGKWFPYAEATRHFDAIAPMVYWVTRDPVAEVTAAIDALAPFGKPIIPIGQAYDAAIDGGPPGAPSKDALVRFMAAAADKGAKGVSFWVWSHATADHWAAIAEAHSFDVMVPS